jgi:hypothetical protein
MSKRFIIFQGIMVFLQDHSFQVNPFKYLIYYKDIK